METIMRKILFIILLTPLIGCNKADTQKSIGLIKVESSDTYQLTNCPSSPNCINSFSDPTDSHYIDPIEFDGTKEQAFDKLVRILKKIPNASITPLSNDHDYIHLEFKSDFFNFIDDVEFYFNENGMIHQRSASRKGYFDLGVNRKRLSEIVFKFHQSR